MLDPNVTVAGLSLMNPRSINFDCELSRHNSVRCESIIYMDSNKYSKRCFHRSYILKVRKNFGCYWIIDRPHTCRNNKKPHSIDRKLYLILLLSWVKSQDRKHTYSIFKLSHTISRINKNQAEIIGKIFCPACLENVKAASKTCRR